MKSYFYDTLAKLIAIPVLILATSFESKAQVPVANFTASPVNGCSPLIVNFQDLSSGNPTSWNWNFGNGNTSTQRNPTATYFTPGTYNITLTATNVNGSNTIVKSGYITVFDAPTVNFSGTPLTGCFPLNVSFTDLSTAGAGTTNTTWWF